MSKEKMVYVISNAERQPIIVVDKFEYEAFFLAICSAEGLDHDEWFIESSCHIINKTYGMTISDGLQELLFTITEVKIY